ncbi:MAG: alpha-L-arabinofuranosidase [Clostridia bacterium]|nr:alpha-L-arabinofuranosidase [Clostridia bacterium]
MEKAKITLHPDYRIGEISPRLFGAFLEPIGSMVNGSMYNPKHPSADELGLRRDFYEALRVSGLPAVRMPGGNFVSGWQWKDSIGPREARKTHLDMAWFQLIPNDVGHDEYLQWAERAGVEPIYTVNLGTGTLQDAADCVEYTNYPGGTWWSDLRRRNGHEAPYGVKTWCLGNEMDGPWQIASREKDPRGYGVLAHETSKAMKWVDPTIETIACVSSSPFLNHYPEWDREVLEECYSAVDYISLHHYHSAPPDLPRALLAGCQAFEDYIRTEIALCDFIRTKLRTKKTMMLALDEYGSMFRPRGEAHLGLAGRQNAEMFGVFDPRRTYVRHDPDDWSTRRMPPSDHEMLQALGMASTMLVMLRHADRLKIGCATGGLGALCRTDREHVWKGASHYPFTQMIRWARGESLQCEVRCARYDVPGYAIDDMNQYGGFTGVPVVQAGAALDEAAEALNVFVVCGDAGESQPLELDVRGFEDWRLEEHVEMFAEDPHAANTWEHPDAILPRRNPDTRLDKGIVTAQLHPDSWNVFRLTRKPDQG